MAPLLRPAGSQQGWLSEAVPTEPIPHFSRTVKDTGWVAARYDLIVVGSGDGIFEVVVRKFRPCGLAVGVVSRRGSLSCVLGATASFVRILPDVPIAEVSA